MPAGVAPDLVAVLRDWSPDPLVALGVAGAAAAYVAGLRALRRRGDAWSAGRTTAFFGGLAVVVVATMSGLGTYDGESFTAHMIQHMLLNMVAPLPLALGAPVTLALRTLPPAPRRRLLALLHSRVARVLASPPLVFGLFIGSTFALYFSGIYPYSLDHVWAHNLVHVHFLVTGCLFAWVVAGLDPLPRPGHGARMLMVVSALPFHAFLGVAMLTQTSLFAGAHYLRGGRSTDALLAEQRTGAGLLWASGEFIGIGLLFAVLAQWMRSDERLAVRTDRHLDRAEELVSAAEQRSARAAAHAERETQEEAALAAYNARLASLHRP